LFDRFLFSSFGDPLGVVVIQYGCMAIYSSSCDSHNDFLLENALGKKASLSNDQFESSIDY
jgi:hypothetical protein